jgi:predicted ABC-type ATPase
VSGIDPRRYLLSEAESERIFRDEIVPAELEGALGVERPRVIFVAGQPGAGKTRTTQAVVEAMESRGGAVVVNSDFYKPFHPEHRRLMIEDDTTAAPYTSLDGRRWMAKAEAYLIEARANVVIETTMRDPGDFQEPAAMFRRAGYDVEVAVMAVPEPLSRMGILTRYEQQVAASGGGRLTEVANHDAAYRGCVQALRDIDEGYAVDDEGHVVRGGADAAGRREYFVGAVEIWQRGGERVYENRLTENGGWTAPAAARQALEAERSRPFTADETRQFLHEYRELAAHGSPVVRAQLPEVLSLARPQLPEGATAALGSASFPAPPRQAVPPQQTAPTAEIDDPRPGAVRPPSHPHERRSGHATER